jgi:large subunit ribosomal protein L11
MPGQDDVKIVKIQLPAGKATPAPPVGTVLGPTGINLQQFCQQFNDATKDKMGDIIPCELTIQKDRSFKFILKTPPAASLIKKLTKVQKGSGEPHKTKVGTITDAQLTEIAKMKMVDLSANDVEAAKKIIAGTARSMGIKVEKK